MNTNRFADFSCLLPLGRRQAIRRRSTRSGYRQFSPQSNAKILQTEQEAWYGLGQLIFPAWTVFVQ